MELKTKTEKSKKKKKQLFGKINKIDKILARPAREKEDTNVLYHK